jgi:hypothetical protein
MRIKLFACSFLLILASCSNVQPWEKEYLAKKTMAFDPDPLEAQFRRHVYQSNEASSGGYSVGVAGCGCYLFEPTNTSEVHTGPFCRPRTAQSHLNPNSPLYFEPLR